MTIDAVVPAGGELPLLQHVKGALEPLLTWAPEWLRALVWALVVFGLLFGLGSWMVRNVLPWLGRVLQQPVATALDACGIVLVLPEYLVTLTLRRMGHSVPGAVVGYGELVQSAVGGVQGALRSALSGLGHLSRVSNRVVALLLLLLLVSWNGTYCNGRGSACVTPTSEWSTSFSAWQREVGADEE